MLPSEQPSFTSLNKVQLHAHYKAFYGHLQMLWLSSCSSAVGLSVNKVVAQSKCCGQLEFFSINPVLDLLGIMLISLLPLEQYVVSYFSLYTQQSQTRTEVSPGLSGIQFYQKGQLLMCLHQLFCIIFEYCILIFIIWQLLQEGNKSKGLFVPKLNSTQSRTNFSLGLTLLFCACGPWTLKIVNALLYFTLFNTQTLIKDK